MKKFILTDETIEMFGVTLHRIKAVRSFSNVKEGDLGGYVEKEENLSHDGKAWVFGEACVSGKACVNGEARVSGEADYIVFYNWWSSGRYFTWTRSNNMWSVGCFYGTGEELIMKAYADSEKSGREYERVVRYVESILEDEKNDNNQEKHV